jgi:hypothetical protein
MRRGRVYYAKLAGGRSMFVAPALISHFGKRFTSVPTFVRSLSVGC